jgi:hypothetical protein
VPWRTGTITTVNLWLFRATRNTLWREMFGGHSQVTDAAEPVHRRVGRSLRVLCETLQTTTP